MKKVETVILLHERDLDYDLKIRNSHNFVFMATARVQVDIIVVIGAFIVAFLCKTLFSLLKCIVLFYI